MVFNEGKRTKSPEAGFRSSTFHLASVVTSQSSLPPTHHLFFSPSAAARKGSAGGHVVQREGVLCLVATVVVEAGLM